MISMDLPSSNGSELWSSTPALSAEPIKSEGEKEQCKLANDLVIIKDKFERYIHLGVLDGDEADHLDLNLHWEASIWLIDYSLNYSKSCSSQTNISCPTFAWLFSIFYPLRYNPFLQNESFQQAKRPAPVFLEVLIYIYLSSRMTWFLITSEQCSWGRVVVNTGFLASL